MERHSCKICYRKFANGRALGGHMRSHMLNLPIVPKPSCETESWAELSPSLSPSLSTSSSSSSEEEDDQEELGESEKELAYKLRENPKRSMKFADHNNNGEFSSFGSSSVSVTKDLERETETEFECEFESESSKQHNNPTKKRSKRRRKQKHPPIETTSPFSPSPSPSPASSVSEVTSEADVALCLMMLSRDNWKCSAAKKDDRFTCLTCNKVFRSYQALGGHRASHKKIRPDSQPQPEPGSDQSKQRKTHECPVCFRVFASAQALGGHKRTHSSTATTVAGGKSGAVQGGAPESNGVDHESPKKKMNALIDLNLPAPVEDHDDEISQVSLSAVSDPHFS